MDSNEAFPGRFLKEPDLRGRQVRAIMDRVEMQNLDGKRKPTLYFQGKEERGLVLNKTNWNSISSTYGDDSNEWGGKEIVLFPATTDFNGRTVPCIRVRTPTVAEQKMKRAAPAKPPVQQVTEDDLATLDDEIPF